MEAPKEESHLMFQVQILSIRINYKNLQNIFTVVFVALEVINLNKKLKVNIYMNKV